MSLLLLLQGGGGAITYLDARAGIARSGAVKSGDYTPSLSITVDGVNRTTAFKKDSWAIELTLDNTPSTLNAVVRDYTPLEGDDIKVSLDGDASGGVLLFAGTVREVTQHATRQSESPRFGLVCQDYQFRLDIGNLVTRRYRSQGINTILADILATYTEGGYRVGYCPQDLGTIDIDFLFEPPSRAIDRLAAAANAFWHVDPQKFVYLYQTLPDGNSLTLTDTSDDFWEFTYKKDLTDIRSWTWVAGVSTTVTAAYAPGATTLSVDDLSIFSDTGFLLAGYSILSYTGRSATSGAGTLTGVAIVSPSIAEDLASGDEVRVLARTTDSGAVTNIQTLIDVTISGLAFAFIDAGDATFSEADERSSNDVTLNDSSRKELAYTTNNVYTVPGKYVTATITTPVSITGSHRIQRVVITPTGAASTDTLGLQRRVTTGPSTTPGDVVLSRFS